MRYNNYITLLGDLKKKNIPQFQIYTENRITNDKLQIKFIRQLKIISGCFVVATPIDELNKNRVRHFENVRHPTNQCTPEIIIFFFFF